LTAAFPTDPVAAALDKAARAGAHDAELAALRRRLRQLTDAEATHLHGDDLSPVGELQRLDDLPEPPPALAREVLDRLVVLKLNGGLGTSMGLSGPKSLLPIKPATSFLDVAAVQVLALREEHGVRLPLVLMNSPATRAPSLAALDAHPGLRDQELPLDFLQGREPKLRADDLQPVTWPADPELEWCPPGHGDLYTALAASGLLATLLETGLRWCFVSNADNTGAVPDPRLAAWIAEEEVPFAMEAAVRTAADRKGGHLAAHGDRLVLREVAQVPPDDDSFPDIARWRWFNTNNLWLDLRALADLQAEDPGGPELPLIVNRKPVDPTDPSTPEVLQLETAMGAAIGSIAGARAVHVPRDRFAPVKTTEDLLLVRSDAFELVGGGRVVPTFEGPPPTISLDPDHYRSVPDLERHLPAGAPSLRRCRSLRVEGPVTFGADVAVEGDVRLVGPHRVPDGAVLRG
jgi:UTP--glucose-1-phosphate uridylyltransferase